MTSGYMLSFMLIADAISCMYTSCNGSKCIWNTVTVTKSESAQVEGSNCSLGTAALCAISEISTLMACAHGILHTQHKLTKRDHDPSPNCQEEGDHLYSSKSGVKGIRNHHWVRQHATVRKGKSSSNSASMVAHHVLFWLLWDLGRGCWSCHLHAQ